MPQVLDDRSLEALRRTVVDAFRNGQACPDHGFEETLIGNEWQAIFYKHQADVSPENISDSQGLSRTADD